MARAAPEEPTDVDGPPWVDEPGEESMPEPPEEGVQTSRRVMEIPVREASLSPRVEQMRDPSEPVRLPEPVITPEGDFWFALVQQMVKAEVVSALVRELALQSQLVARDADQWLLRVERESLNQPSTRERLSTALQSQGHAVRLAVEIGPVSDSASLRLAAEANRRQREAERIIHDDPLVQAMMRDFGGRIVPGSLRATEA
jgi:DNA polymerase-3 subunit gamma/tau